MSKKEATANKNNEISQDQLTAEEAKKEFKVLVTPLIVYGVIALGIVGIIVTTALVIEDRITIAGDVRHTDVEAVAANETSPVLENTAPNIETVATTAKVKEKPAEVIAQQNLSEPKSIQNDIQAQLATSVISNKTTKPESLFVKNIAPNQFAKAQMVRFYETINQNEQKNIQRINSNKDRQIEVLRKQLAHQSELLEKRITQLEAIYEQRTSTLQKNIERRKSMLNRV